MTASSFIPKLEDHSLVWKGPQGEMRGLKREGGSRSEGHREVGGQRVFWEWERPHYLPATLAAAPLLGLKSGSQHSGYGGL